MITRAATTKGCITATCDKLFKHSLNLKHYNIVLLQRLSVSCIVCFTDRLQHKVQGLVLFIHFLYGRQSVTFYTVTLVLTKPKEMVVALEFLIRFC